jgi:hypothetical protein
MNRNKRQELITSAQKHAKPAFDALREMNARCLWQVIEPGRGANDIMLIENWWVGTCAVILVYTTESWDVFAPVTPRNSVSETIEGMKRLQQQAAA